MNELFGHSGSSRDKPDYKTLMLCRQVERALLLALAGECDDEMVDQLMVQSVEPWPNAGHLLVRVAVPQGLSVAEVLLRLEKAKPKLRHAVGQSISRKRVPELSFVPMAMPIFGSQEVANEDQ